MSASYANENNMSNLKFKLTICRACLHRLYFGSGLQKAEGGHASQHLHHYELKPPWTNNGVRKIRGCSAGNKLVDKYDVSLTITRLAFNESLDCHPTNLSRRTYLTKAIEHKVLLFVIGLHDLRSQSRTLAVKAKAIGIMWNHVTDLLGMTQYRRKKTIHSMIGLGVACKLYADWALLAE